MEMDQNIFKHLLNTEVTLYQLCKLDLSSLHYLLLPMEYLLSMKVVIPCTLVEELSTAIPHINKLQKLYTTTLYIKLKKFDNTTTPHIKKFDMIIPRTILKKMETTNPQIKQLPQLLEDQLPRAFLLLHIARAGVIPMLQAPRRFSPQQLLLSPTLLHILATTQCSHTILSFMLLHSLPRSMPLPYSLPTTQVYLKASTFLLEFALSKPHQSGLDTSSHRMSSQGQALHMLGIKKKFQ